MDELPFELLEKIFKLLPIHNQLICKIVNRKWYTVISHFKYRKLVISDTWNLKEAWLPDFKPIDNNEIIQIKKFNPSNLKSVFEFNFLNLKSLFIYSSKKTDNKGRYVKSNFKISDLVNELKELESLNINGFYLNEVEDCISLESLKTMNVEEFLCGKLLMDTPNLINLRLIKSSWSIDFKYPKNIKVFYVDKVYSSYIEAFTNLEYFYVEHIYDVLDTFLIELPNLLEFHFESSNSWNTFEDLLDYKRRHGRINFKPFMFNINFGSLMDICQVDSYYWINRDYIELFKLHPTKLSNIMPFIYALNYSDLEDAYQTADKLPLELVNKFVNLQLIFIKRKVNKPNELIKVLNSISKIVRKIEINQSSLNQEFFDQLPSLVPILEILTIKNEPEELDFKFITKFQNIKSVEVDQKISTEIIDEFITKFESEFKFICHKDGINPVRIHVDCNGILRTQKIKIKNDSFTNTMDLLGSNLNLDNLFETSSLSDLEIDELI